jgi:hypothetical protein
MPAKRKLWIKGVLVGLMVTVSLIALFYLVFPVDRSTLVDVSLSVREFSFRTDSRKLLSAANFEQFIVSRIASVDVRGRMIKLNTANQHQINTDHFVLNGDPLATCTFYNVRTDGVELSGASSLVLLWPDHAGDTAFAIKSHGPPLTGTLTAQPSARSKSGFACTQVRLNGELVTNIDGKFTNQDAIYFTTENDTQLDFRGSGSPTIGDTQISVLDDVRFSRAEYSQLEPLRPPEPKSVLMPTRPGQSYEIIFEETNKKLVLRDGDLLLIRPEKGFYIRKFSINHGIQLSLHGKVKDLKTGSGSNDQNSQMPSRFEQLNSARPVLSQVWDVLSVFAGIGVFLEIVGKLKWKKRVSARRK